MLGTAIGLKLLFHIPLIAGVCITLLDTVVCTILYICVPLYVYVCCFMCVFCVLMCACMDYHIAVAY